MSTPWLQAKALTRRFGGLAAVDQVSLELWPDRIHAVIGPNGAGKSTLTNLLSGDLPPSSGQILLRGQDVTGWSPARIARLGLGRSYQKTNIFPAFSVWENVRLAAQLTGWKLDIISDSKFRQMEDDALVVLKEIDGVDEELAKMQWARRVKVYADAFLVEKLRPHQREGVKCVAWLR